MSYAVYLKNSTIQFRMFLKKLFIYLKTLKLEFLIKQINPDTSDKIYDIILSDIVAQYFNKKNTSYTSTHFFDCVFHNLREYNQAISRVNILLKNNSKISPDWCRYETIKVTYNEMFTDQYYYIDPITEINDLVKNIRVFKAELSSIQNEGMGVKGYNYRHLSRFNLHLNNLILQLIKTSYELYLFKPVRLQ